MKQICNNCGTRIGNKTPDNGCTWWIGTCNFCSENNQYVTAPRDFGIYSEESEGVKRLKNLFGINR